MLRANPTFDAQAALGFLISQVSQIEADVYAIRYGDIQYPNLVPVDTSGHPWARTVTYFTTDEVGQADWMNGDASDMPFAELSGRNTRPRSSRPRSATVSRSKR